MLGRKLTFCLNPEGNHFVFNAKIDHATAEGAYDKLTVPVIGSGVVYDIPNAKFMEQKKFVKDALTTTAFRSYVPILIQEAREFYASLPDEQDKLEIFHATSELTIRTASHCLLGEEVRSKLYTNVAQLFQDLDQGLRPVNIFIRNFPNPTYRRRDEAHRKMSELFLNIIRDRRQRNTHASDIIQPLLEATYKDGTPVPDIEIAHLMIAMLIGGQHTSATSTAWVLFELANNPNIIPLLLKEQSEVLTNQPDTPISKLPDFDYDHLRRMPLLDCVIKESLRLHPPIHTVMRLVVKDVEFKGYTIPEGHFLCGSQGVSHMDPARFPEPEKFDPKRHMLNEEDAGEWTINGVDIAQKSAKSHFLPFGAGRHRCIGEQFAFLQIKTIIALFIREFKHELQKDKTGQRQFPKMDYTSMIVMPEKGSYISIKRRK
ncbi:Lanosterol 14-alpha-demethylase [Rhizophlyctis rosea]|nr:Lanosterol 14-alpha-demethylase [Rhizophlyctis rosea]